MEKIIRTYSLHKKAVELLERESESRKIEGEYPYLPGDIISRLIIKHLGAKNGEDEK